MQRTKIQWAEYVWNPITGCRPGLQCWDRCYARRMATRLAGRAGYDKDEPFRPTTHLDRMDEPRRLKKPAIIFACSMGDMFVRDIPSDHLYPIYDTIVACPQHTFIILTKRPENIRDVPVIPNLWLGISAETQADYEIRWPSLINNWAGNRLVSLEPLLGSIGILGLNPWPRWVIAGPETGPGARTCDIRWAMDLSNDCADRQIPFFWKGGLEFGLPRQYPIGTGITQAKHEAFGRRHLR